MTKIINIRGGHGTGKSTIVRRLLDHEDFEVEGLDHTGRKNRPSNYRITHPSLKQPVYVVGSYETACGGCDGIQPYATIWDRITGFKVKGHVIFEGALVSSSYGNIGRASEEYGDDIMFCFMNTPLNEALNRIRKRRKDRGDEREFNPKNAVYKWRQVRRKSIKQFIAAKRNILFLDAFNGYDQVEKLLEGLELKSCPFESSMRKDAKRIIANEFPPV